MGDEEEINSRLEDEDALRKVLDEKKDAKILEEIRNPPVGYMSPPREGQWKPGQTGNPGGRPKWKPLTEALQNLLEEEPALNKELVKAWVVKAGRGDVSAANMLWDRLEGKVTQTIGGSTDTGPVKLVIEWEK